MKIPIFIFLFITSSIFSFNLRDAKQQYDSYVFAIQWPNGYCKVNGCEPYLDNMEANIMNIHGLWPSLKTGKSLKTCTSGVQIVEENSKLFSDMKRYWPSFKGSNVDFWSHEYNKHGYCMVEEFNWDDYDDYFKFVITLYLKDYKYLIQKAFSDRGSRQLYTITYEEMQKRIRAIIPNAVFKMNCSLGYIFEFYFYLEKDFTPSKNSQFANNCKSGQLIFK